MVTPGTLYPVCGELDQSKERPGRVPDGGPVPLGVLDVDLVPLLDVHDRSGVARYLPVGVALGEGHAAVEHWLHVDHHLVAQEAVLVGVAHLYMGHTPSQT